MRYWAICTCLSVSSPPDLIIILSAIFNVCLPQLTHGELTLYALKHCNNLRSNTKDFL